MHLRASKELITIYTIGTIAKMTMVTLHITSSMAILVFYNIPCMAIRTIETIASMAILEEFREYSPKLLQVFYLILRSFDVWFPCPILYEMNCRPAS